MYRYPVQMPNGSVLLYKSQEAADSVAALHGGKVLDRIWKGSQPEPEPPAGKKGRKADKEEAKGDDAGNQPPAE